MIEGPSACGREQSIRARDPNNRFRHGRGSRYRGAVPWPPPTSSPLPDLRFHHGKCAQSIEGEDGKMCPTTVSPLAVSVGGVDDSCMTRKRGGRHVCDL
jgi:hypothetical protein